MPPYGMMYYVGNKVDAEQFRKNMDLPRENFRCSEDDPEYTLANLKNIRDLVLGQASAADCGTPVGMVIPMSKIGHLSASEMRELMLHCKDSGVHLRLEMFDSLITVSENVGNIHIGGVIRATT